MLGLNPSQAWIYHSVTIARRQGSERATRRIPKTGGKAQWRTVRERSQRPRAEERKYPNPQRGWWWYEVKKG